MDSTVLIFLSGLFGVLCIGREIANIVRVKRIRISNLFLIMYGLTYGIILALLLILNETGVYRADGTFMKFDYSVEGIKSSALWFMAAVVGYISFQFGSMLRIGTNTPREIVYTRPQRPDDLLLERLQLTSIICLAIGIVCFIIWTEGWGGYSNLFINAAAIRNSSYGIRNKVAFFAKPAQIVATVSIISLYLYKQKKNLRFNSIMFVISFAISVLYYLAKDGRMGMAMYLLIVLFMANDMFEKQNDIGRKFSRLACLFVIFVLIVLNMDYFTSFLRGKDQVVGSNESALVSVMSELSFVYVAGQTAIEHCVVEGSPLLIGHDIGSALFAWVPSALTPKGFVNIWNYNTELISGGQAIAQYPSDLISTSLYDLGNMGPILLPAFWGALINKLERINEGKTSPIIIVLYYSLSMALLRVVDYSMFSGTVASAFHLFVAAVVYWGVGHVKVRV